ncbi:MAG TPA: hypothetical protein ENO27_01725 [Caldithrix sp.]|nr:hypothetical protein [Calditrichaceae bacterium]HEM48907.1 hypothetical protein [Caldithrix sp.]
MKINIISTQTGFVFIIALFLILLVSVNAQQSDCSKVLDQAQNLYYEGKFDESMNLVQSCLTSEELTKEESRRAYKIMSQVELARGDQEKAKKNIRLLLEVDPDYTPTIEQETPTYVQLVESVRSELVVKDNNVVVKKESGGISKWWYYSAGAVVAGTAYILLNNDDGKKKDKPLDTPPPWGDK